MTTVRRRELISEITQKYVDDGLPAWEARLMAEQEVAPLDDHREIVETSLMWSPFRRRDYVGAILP
jgi:hypothetical protein